MLLEWFIENCMRNSIFKSLKNDINAILKLLLKISTTNYCGTAIIIDVAIRGNKRIIDKEKKKTEK